MPERFNVLKLQLNAQYDITFCELVGLVIDVRFEFPLNLIKPPKPLNPDISTVDKLQFSNRKKLIVFDTVGNDAELKLGLSLHLISPPKPLSVVKSIEFKLLLSA